MASYQRRHGLTALIYPVTTVTDGRGDTAELPDLDHPYQATVAVFPQRSQRAELPGQQDIDVTRLILSSDLPGVTSQSLVFYQNSWWDVVMPPAYHHGTKHVRHWSMDIRRRPSGWDPF